MTQIEKIADAIRRAREPVTKAELVVLLMATREPFSLKADGMPQDRAGIMGILGRVLDVDVKKKGGTSRFLKITKRGEPVRWYVRKVKRQ